MENQLRAKISEIIIELPENKLKPVLQYLKQIKNVNSEELNTVNLIEKIFEEDSELLNKLAQ